MAVTIDEVKDVKSTILSNNAIQLRIDAASMVVSRLNTRYGTSFTTAQLEEIQLWLTAHFIAISDPDSKRQTVGKTDVDITYHVGTLGAGINASMYGQTANMLSGGILESEGEKPINLTAHGSAQGRNYDL